MPELLYDKYPEQHYAIFTMNRPDSLNALGRPQARELSAALQDFTNDPDMRVGILTGNGRAFSAGGDLKEMAEDNATIEETEAQFEAGSITLEERMDRLKDLGLPKLPGSPGNMDGLDFSRNPKPFIAAVNGMAIAEGVERAMDCDIRIASTDAYFALYEVKRGILADYALHSLSRVMPFGEAMYLLLTGDSLTAQDAHRFGFVHEVVEPERLLPRAIEIAEMIAANAPLAVQGSKAVARFWRHHAVDESYRFGDLVSRQVLNSADAIEGPRAFAEKRAPVWTGH